jgi:hypothetical protein
MDFMEGNLRDENGRLRPGHKGLKPKGATNRLQGEIKERITLFLSGKLESLEEIYSQVSPKEKLHFLTELLAYVLPKSKELKIEDHSQNRTAQIDYSKLSENTLMEILKNTNIEQDETEN